VYSGATTLRTELNRMGYVWKRARYSLKKLDPERFEQACHNIEHLISRANAGEIELA